MKLSFKDERLLAVVAHPDDAELLCAGTLARAREDDAAIAICVLCKGDKGQPSKPIRNLAAVRRKELEAAARLLGVKVFRGGCPDGSLKDEQAQRLALTEIFRQFKPTLVLAHAPEDYHPDHQAASKLAEVASWFCASRGQVTPTPALAQAPALWWMDTITMAAFHPGLYVDITAYIELKEQMLACHRSQMARAVDADFSLLTELMRLQYRTRGAQAGVTAAEAFRPYHAFKRTRAW